MAKRRDAFIKALAQAVTLTVAAAPASTTLSKDRWPVERGPVPSEMQDARAETFQAIAISRLAERFCDGAYVFNPTKAENALKLLYLDSFDDIPKSVDERYSLAFQRNRPAACALAYQLYVIGSGAAPPFNQFLLVRGPDRRR
jgi:hypothetical protein